jgi:hypothetical protein
MDRLDELGMRLLKVPGDGLCFYAAVGLQLQNARCGPCVRKACNSYLEGESTGMQRYRLGNDNPDWADLPDIAAAARFYRQEIIVIHASGQIQIFNRRPQCLGLFSDVPELTSEMIHGRLVVAYNGKDHYNAVVRKTDARFNKDARPKCCLCCPVAAKEASDELLRSKVSTRSERRRKEWRRERNFTLLLKDVFPTRFVFKYVYL